MAILDATRKTVHVTRNQLIAKLAALQGATMVSVIAQTDPGKNKACKGQVVKQSHVNGVLNWNYEAAVNRQQGREGGEQDFIAQPRKWGERIKGTPLVTHKGNTYLEVKVERALKTEYFEVRPDGSLVGTDRESIAHLLRPHRSNAPHQGVEREVVLRDYRLDNLVEIRMGGVCYQIIG